jgi:hypothetical protein
MTKICWQISCYVRVIVLVLNFDKPWQKHYLLIEKNIVFKTTRMISLVLYFDKSWMQTLSAITKKILFYTRVSAPVLNFDKSFVKV